MKLSGFKSLGEDGWVGFFSNIFYDRDVKPDAPQGERFTLDSHKEYAAWASHEAANLPELEFWHLPNVVMGKATEVEVWGPFIIAKGQWADTEMGAKAKSYFSTTEQDWAMSHGYRYQLEDRKGGEYHRYRTHEVTVLPPDWAANPVTLFMEGSSMAQKGILDDLKQSLRDMLGVDEATAGQIASEGLSENKALSEAAKTQGQGTGTKEGDAEAAPAAAPADAAAAGDEAVSDDQLALALANVLIATNQLLEQNQEQGKQIKALTEAMAATQQSVKALQDADEARKTLLPKAVLEALTQRASEKGAPVDAADVAKDVAQQAAALDAKGADDGNPLDWFMGQALPKK